MTNLKTPVWELHGLTGSEPGLLALTDGKLSFETEKGLRFEAPLAEITDVRWPWYSFSAALNLTAKGVKYRFSFARPNGAGAAWRPAAAAQGVFDLGSAIQNGKTWKAELAQQMRSESAGKNL
jgi:hypothetical protein